jgi:hypothetical protein
LILRNSSQPVVFGSGVIDGNVAISFASPPAMDNQNLPRNAVYFFNNQALRLKGNLKIANAHEENFFLYGQSPSAATITNPGEVIMEKGFSTSVDLDSLPIEETFEKLNKICSDGRIQCDHPQSDLADKLIRAQAPEAGWMISEARLQFGSVDNQCELRIEQTEIDYESRWLPNCGLNCANCSCPDGFRESCLGIMVLCERLETRTRQVWPESGSARVPDNSVIVIDSRDIRIQSLDPSQNQAETCGSSFTVLGTQAGQIRFDKSFVDTDLTGNPHENLKVAFALIGGNESSSATAAQLDLDTVLRNGVSINNVYSGSAPPPD